MTYCTAYRVAHGPATPRPPLSDPRQIYHTLHPHPALSPVPVDADPASVREQRENEAVWRQLLVHGILAVLLPTEDLDNACLRTLVAEILAETVLGNGIGGKACEGWLLWESITKVVETARPGVGQPEEKDAENGEEEEEEGGGDDDQPASPTSKLEQGGSRLERFGLLSSQDKGSASASAARRAEDEKEQSRAGAPASMATMVWQAMRWLLLGLVWTRAIVVALATASSLPGRAGETPSIKRPIVAMRVWTLAGSLLELDGRMPWLAGALALGQWMGIAGPGRVADTDGAVDR